MDTSIQHAENYGEQFTLLTEQLKSSNETLLSGTSSQSLKSSCDEVSPLHGMLHIL
jgi:hypothetical protein